MSLRLILVDDHKMLREGLRRSLEELGFAVIAEAGDGEEGVRLAAAMRPDVMLMDVSMPEMDGVEACRQIVERNPNAKVVMLTMHADRDIVDRALKAGAVGYLTKDCSIDEVAEAVKLASNGETAMSPALAAGFLAEARKLDSGAERDEDRIITKREEEVLQLIADGCSTPEVAAKLYISQKTVKNHLASIYEKLNARDRTQAVITAVRMGIITLN
jgi:two-component system response regulator DegU